MAVARVGAILNQPSPLPPPTAPFYNTVLNSGLGSDRYLIAQMTWSADHANAPGVPTFGGRPMQLLSTLNVSSPPYTVHQHVYGLDEPPMGSQQLLWPMPTDPAGTWFRVMAATYQGAGGASVIGTQGFPGPIAAGLPVTYSPSIPTADGSMWIGLISHSGQGGWDFLNYTGTGSLRSTTNLGQSWSDGTTAPATLSGYWDSILGAGAAMIVLSLSAAVSVAKWYAWGANFSGVLGVGDAADRPETPTPMLLPDDVSGVSIGFQHGLGLLAGATYAWGDNDSGQLGLPRPPTTYPTPTVVSSMTGVIAVASSASYSVALKSDGTFWCTGTNGQGQFGNGSFTTTPSFTWTRTTGAPPNIARIWSGDQTTAVVDTAGQLWMAGWRQDNIIPDGIASVSSPPRYTTFFKCISVPTPVLDFALGGDGALALYNDGTVHVWGDVNQGRAGDGVNHTSTRYNLPVLVPGLSNIVAIAAANNTYFALDNAGRLWTWGENFEMVGGIASATPDRGDPILSPTRWSNATSMTVEWIGQLGAYAFSTAVKGSDGKFYGSGTNLAPTRGLVCRAVEQPPGTSGWQYIPGPTQGYPELGMPVVVAFATQNATIAKWAPAPAPTTGISAQLVMILG